MDGSQLGLGLDLYEGQLCCGEVGISYKVGKVGLNFQEGLGVGRVEYSV